MNLGKVQYNKQRVALALLCLVIVGFLISVAYHDFYAGDELEAFKTRLESAEAGSDVFSTLSEYKPRVVFNALIAILVDLSSPRIVWAMIFCLFFSGCMYAAIRLLDLDLNDAKDFCIAVMMALVVTTSRYFYSYYYEYNSAIIDSIALFFFIIGVSKAKNVLDQEKMTGSLMQVALCFMLAALTYERYAVFALAFMLPFSIRSLLRKQYRHAVCIAVLSVIPLFTFFVLALILAKTSIMTGTAGQEIIVSAEIVTNMLKYFVNVVFGASFGPEYFWGQLQNKDVLHVVHIMLVSSATILALRGLLNERKNWSKSGELPFQFGIILSVLSAFVVNSLPSSQRMEMRWVGFIFVMLLIFVIRNISQKKKILVAGLLLVSNIMFLAIPGILKTNSCIAASRSAKKFGGLLNTVEFDAETIHFKGHKDVQWMYLGARPDVYCIANRNALSGNRGLKNIFYHAWQENLKIEPGSIVIDVVAFDGAGVPIYGLELSGAEIADSGRPERMLGYSRSWGNWKLSHDAVVTEEGVLLPDGADGFFEIPARELRKKKLLYEVVSSNTAQVRWQINWHDAQDRFVNTTIEVVDLENESKTYLKKIYVPSTAEKAYIYLSRHGSYPGTVVFKSVKLLAL